MRKHTLTLLLALAAMTAILAILLADGGQRSPLQRQSCPSIGRGVAFLDSQFDAQLGLLSEAPQAAPNKYWLANDNVLAAHVLSELGYPERSEAILASLKEYGRDGNGWIEVIRGTPVEYPPHIPTAILVAQVGTKEIWQEAHDSGPRFEDWAEYANLGFLGALNEYHRGRIAQARTIYAKVIEQFDGTGFADRAFAGLYETYKLALALSVGSTIGAPIPQQDRMLSILVSMQRDDGGFVTHYRDPGAPDGDANTETTALALLAMDAFLCRPDQSLGK